MILIIIISISCELNLHTKNTARVVFPVLVLHLELTTLCLGKPHNPAQRAKLRHRFIMDFELLGSFDTPDAVAKRAANSIEQQLLSVDDKHAGVLEEYQLWKRKFDAAESLSTKKDIQDFITNDILTLEEHDMCPKSNAAQAVMKATFHRVWHHSLFLVAGGAGQCRPDIGIRCAMGVPMRQIAIDAFEEVVGDEIIQKIAERL